MYLSRVELAGFKSFADKTTFDLDQGITAILGPNGCGKSNVVDAIKWVLGESSAKNLRGSQMQDVIFAGSEGRKPLGLAEVTLYFNNEDGALAIDYNEVSVTRKLFRSGESEYQINKQQCRKRDIRDLFLDTGVGMSAYSFIEQGRVEALLQAKPAERRLVIEEAAGISKYKQRRKESLARLGRTNQYLYRVNDIVEEIEKNIRRVSRQAASARRWQKLSAELAQVKELYYTRTFKGELEKLAKIAEEKAEVNSLYSQEAALESATTEKITILTGNEFELNKKVEESEQEFRQVQEELGRIQVELATNLERKESLSNEKKGAWERAAHLETVLAGSAHDKSSMESELSEIADRLEEFNNLFNSKDQGRGELQRNYSLLEKSVDELRNAILELSQRQNILGSEKIRIESRQDGINEQLTALVGKAAESSGVRSQLKEEVEVLNRQLSECSSKTEELNLILSATRNEQRECSEKLQQNERELSSLQAQASAKESRRSTLQDLENEFDGAFAGVRAALKAKQQGRYECSEIEGMVADLITVDPEYAIAIETVLGSQAQDIVVRSGRGAQECIEYLKNNRAGRATFLPLDRIRARKPLQESLLHERGVVGEAFELVDFADQHQPAMEYLLNGVLIAENLSVARDLSRSRARGVRIVTLSGEVINPHGAMTGGDGKQKRGGLIARKAEKDALAGELVQLKERMDVLSGECEAVVEQISQFSGRITATENELAELVRHGQLLEREFSVKESEYKRLENDYQNFESDKCRFEQELSELSVRKGENESSLLVLKNDEEILEQELADTLIKQQNLRVEMDQAGEELALAREERAKLNSKVDELKRLLAAAEETKLERESELERCRTIALRVDSEQTDIGCKIEELKNIEENLLYKRDNAKRSDTSDREKLAGIREEIDNLRNIERAAQKRLQEATQALNDFKIRENEIKIRMDNISEKAERELQIADLRVVVEKFVEENTPQVSPVTGEVIINLGQEEKKLKTSEGIPFATLTDEQVKQYIDNLVRGIEKIGPVNMCAIEELAELEARAEFLKSEQSDIEEAAGNLQATIEKLNDECYRRFENTFTAVRENFQEMFQYLFGGGRADLILEDVPDDQDKLDAGIEIIARPPGKEPKSISLLSGGEKALCAVGLLFAIFRSKPSPFCILDEVDGPLDESNIDRFMSAVRKFTAETQFILISHSKRTMSQTDTIYGVTQQQPGVSTKYSLRFRDASDRVHESENVTEFEDEMQLA